MSMSTSLLFFFFFNHVFSLSQDGLFLQQLKLGLSDPDARLADWNDRDASPCGWPGVRCNSAGSVASLRLPSFSLAGPFPSPDLLCRLPALSSLSLADNFLSGPLPASIARCRNLTYLDLSLNLLVGELPSSLAALPALRYLDLTGNNFSGPIPASFAAFPRLEVLSLVNNLLNDTIPAFLSNVSTLRQLNLSYNPFAAGELPAELGKLRNLEILWLTKCNLVGRIPASLGDLKKLTDLDLSVNNLMGPIPEALNGLFSVVQIELYNNSLSGHLPNGWSNLTSLKRFDASMNLLEGEIPSDLCELQLESLNLYSNRLTGVVPEAISKSPNLYELRLFENRLSGQLPSGLGRNSPLRWVDLSGNPLSGEIPPGICDKGKLEELLLIDNSLEGPIPESLGECRSLVRVRLRGNKLSGEVPEGLWGLPRMQLLELSWNSLSGEVSHLISGASNLSIFLISNNKFIGKIPPEIGSVGNLEKFVAAMNLFSGPIPATLSRLSELATLDLHGNELSGELPENINSCKKLSDLNLANNQLTGNIPNGIGSLPVLNYLDLSNNLLTGEIPIELQNLKLNRFNLSNNLLSGKLPPLYANQNYRLSFLNNPGLCGDLTGLCSPSGRTSEWHRGNAWLLATIFALAGLILVAGLACVYWRYRKFKKGKTGWSKTKWTLTSFHKLVFSEHDIFDSLDEDNVIGSGSSGKVYKAVLNNGEVVAVKKLWGASKDGNSDDFQHCDDGFEAEVETLGKIRHKNIVKLWCACTARDCKLLVYEYMPNGSLGDLLHGGKGGGLLDWPARLRIALDAAEGLSYLHHDCVPPIVHRDVKSNNILLDGEFRARVADFGVAKMVEAVGEGPKSMSVIAGSCGYIAPEYAYTLRVNEKSDIYSFGVVILELLTGRRAIDPEYGEKDLVKWVCFTLEQKGVENVLDPNIDACYNEEMCKVMKIGLMCTAPLPINRPAMQRVVKMLQEISPSSKMKPAKKDGRLSPYYYDDESDRGSVL